MKKLIFIGYFILIHSLYASTNPADYVESEIKTTAESAHKNLKKCNKKDLSKCFDDIRTANLPFEMNHGQQTEYVALLVHGLSDSPYFYRHLSQHLFKKGLNVVAVRLTGMGTSPSHLRSVHYSEWLKDIEFGKMRAKQLGKKIIVAGMSLGGLIATYDVLLNQQDYAGIMLFGPALAMPAYFSIVGLNPMGYAGEKEYGVGVRYQKIANWATVQLRLLSFYLNRPLDENKDIKHYMKRGLEHLILGPVGPIVSDIKFQASIRKENFKTLKLPLFSVLTDYDLAIRKDAALDLANYAQNSTLYLYSDGTNHEKLPTKTRSTEIGKLAHASLLLKDEAPNFTNELNPDFDNMILYLDEYLADNFSIL